MEQWEQVIVEWINCLEVLKEPLKNTEKLQDHPFYNNFLNLISWTKHYHDHNQEDIITKFIEDEYPSFKINRDDNKENIYIASLLLLHTSQETIFHLPMCNKLKYETQIQIKTFLENILPLGRDITKETMKEVVTELQEISNTPNDRQTTPLKDFANSPAFRSARSSYKIMTERTRELRELRCNLDMERFKNAELRDDLTFQQNKIQDLKKNLEEKAAQIKTLHEERIKPCTPQPSHKKNDTSFCENYYKKYINDLEIQLNKQQDTIDNLESEKDVLSKSLASVQRQCAQYKESFVNCERSLESLSNKVETKDRELVGLRIHNEELRVHIKELNKNSVIEQSFEVEESIALPYSVRTSLNTSEALSSVIEIQLQEAKEESAILRSQIDSLKEKFEVLTKDYRNVMELNRDLQEKTKVLNEVQAELSDIKKELHIANTNTTNLQAEKTYLIVRNEDLKNSLVSKEERLFEIEQRNATLNMKLDNLKLDIENLNELLKNEKINSSDLNAVLAQVRSQISEHLTYIHNLTEERDSYKSSIENCSKSLINTLHNDNPFIQIESDNFDNITLNDIVNYFNTMLHNCNTICTSYKYDIKTLKKTIDETNANLHNQQLTIGILKTQNEQTIIELTHIEEERKQNNLLLDEQKETIHKYSQEIEILKEVKNEKSILEENVHKLNKDLINQGLLLKSTMTHLRNLQDVMKDYKLMKQETQQRFIEYQENIKITFEKIHHSYQTLYHHFCKTEKEKDELECNFNRTEEELSNVKITNFTLQQNLSQYRDKVKILKEKKGSLCNEINKYKQNIQELEEIKQTLEEQCKTIRIEANDNLESLKSKNAKISLELKNITNTFNLLQEEMSNTMMQMESETAHINELLSDISALQTEKDYLIRSHKEALVAKDEEIKSKEETISTLQIKMEKFTDEANTSDKKLKEVIINLQEVRSSQDAVLATQEIALKEKCLHIDELQKEIDKSKENNETLEKQLEDEKLSHRELETKFSELEHQLHGRDRDIEELQEKLKIINIELEASKDHCKFIDASQAEIIKLCQELEHPTKNLNSTIMETCSNFDIFSQNLHDMTQYECIYTDDKTKTILNIIKITLDELYKSQKVILHLSLVNTELNQTLAEQKALIIKNIKDKEEICNLKNRIQELEIIAQKRDGYLNSLIKSKESLKDSLQEVFISRNDLDTVLKLSKETWNEILTKFQDILHTDISVCDEYKQLQAKRADVENILSKYYTDHLENIKFTYDILWEKFLWTEKKLHDTYLCSVHEKECLDMLTNVEDQFSIEKVMIDTELKKNKILQADITKMEKEMQSFVGSVGSYENSIKSGEIKTQAEIEKNLQNQINQLAKEKRDLKSKIDNMRIRNVKLERNMDDLRVEIKKLKSDMTSATDVEVQSLNNQLKHLKEQNKQLHEEKDKLSKTAKQEFENQLKEVHGTYELKLEDMKQKMKKAYNEQITKINSDQDKIIREKLHNQMQSMCQKQREEINKYKLHVGDLSSQLWSVGEKLLIEQQQKQDALKCLKELQIKFKGTEMAPQMSTVSHKTSRLGKQEMLPENVQQTTHKVTVITEERFERRHSVRNIQAMGNAFKAEDEEEVFDNVYLADMKSGNALPTTDVDRLSVLQMRNAQCKPHLKSSYPAEMQFLPPILTEEEIKTGCISEDIFNDSLSQSLLPEQKAKKKDRSQTSYKKPGPPTPSKNGGRSSLQGNELKSPNSRILRERNIDRRTTTTPRALKHLFMLKRQDENASSTPKGRRLSSLFRKPRGQA